MMNSHTASAGQGSVWPVSIVHAGIADTSPADEIDATPDHVGRAEREERIEEREVEAVELAEHRELETAVKAPLDQAAGVNDLIDQQDAAQRKAMDEQGR